MRAWRDQSRRAQNAYAGSGRRAIGRSTANGAGAEAALNARDAGRHSGSQQAPVAAIALCVAGIERLERRCSNQSPASYVGASSSRARRPSKRAAWSAGPSAAGNLGQLRALAVAGRCRGEPIDDSASARARAHDCETFAKARLQSLSVHARRPDLATCRLRPRPVGALSTVSCWKPSSAARSNRMNGSIIATASATITTPRTWSCG